MLALYNGRICGSWDSAFADCSAGPNVPSDFKKLIIKGVGEKSLAPFSFFERRTQLAV